MELIPAQNSDGTWMFYAKCEKHNWWYKGKPPLISGCPECWKTYLFMQGALNPETLGETTELLESAVHHMLESTQRGDWDFKLLRHPEISIDKEPD